MGPTQRNGVPGLIGCDPVAVEVVADIRDVVNEQPRLLIPNDKDTRAASEGARKEWERRNVERK